MGTKNSASVDRELAPQHEPLRGSRKPTKSLIEALRSTLLEMIVNVVDNVTARYYCTACEQWQSNIGLLIRPLNRQIKKSGTDCCSAIQLSGSLSGLHLHVDPPTRTRNSTPQKRPRLDKSSLPLSDMSPSLHPIHKTLITTTIIYPGSLPISLA